MGFEFLTEMPKAKRGILDCRFVHRVHKLGMARPRTKNGKGIHFPYAFEHNGRTGRIKKWKFGIYFLFAGKPMRSSFSTFEKAYQFLDREFSKLDTDGANSPSTRSMET